MNLGNMIDTLEQFNPELDIDLGDFHSYRGYYDRLAIPKIPFGTYNVGEVLAQARYTVGKTFEGYKGGDYTMDESTPVYVAEWGESSGLGLVGFQVDGDGLKSIIADVETYEYY